MERVSVRVYRKVGESCDEIPSHPLGEASPAPRSARCDADLQL